MNLDNGTIKIGIDLVHGGGINYLSESGSSYNVVNVADYGRYIQQSYYSGPQPYIPDGATQNPTWSNWAWNPVQAGDSYGYTSQVLDNSNDGTTLYVKSIPKQWALRNVDAESTMETWITLAANRAQVRHRLTNSRADTTQYWAPHQELPAVYTIGQLEDLYTYEGNAPFTGGALTKIDNILGNGGWGYWNSSENWAAHVNSSGWGLGVFTPGANLTAGGFAGTPGIGGPYQGDTGYMSPLISETMDLYYVAHAPQPGTTMPGDFDSDDDVDGSDFLAWQQGLGFPNGAALSDGDADGDGGVDSDDLELWQANYGTVITSSESLGLAVPEPAGLAIVLLGWIMILSWRF